VQRPALAPALRLAALLTVLHQEKAEYLPLVLNAEQRIVLDALLRSDRVIVLKGRQQGVSTVAVFFAFVWAILNPGVFIAVVADVADKAEGLVAKVQGWASKVGGAVGVEVSLLGEDPSAKRIRFPNGAEIHAITANTKDVGSDEVKAGRSFSYGLIILSEFAYYTRAAALMASLTSSALKGAPVLIESTATPAKNRFREIWDAGEGWEHVFLSVELHEAYRHDPQTISDERWAELQDKYKFTRRDTAAWWDWKLRVDMGGDVHRMLREYPVLEEQAFSFAEGRWIYTFTPAEPRFDGEWFWYVDVPLAENEDGSKTYAAGEPVVFGVDTAHGVGEDASSISIRGQRTRRVFATFKANDVGTTQFAAKLKAAIRAWAPVAVVVEDNGIGGATYDALASAGAPVHRQHSEHVEKWNRMMALRSEIGSGVIPAGPELRHEIEHSVQKTKVVDGRVVVVFDGPDDLLNAHSFAGKWIDENPFRGRAPALNPLTHIDQKARLKQRAKARVRL